MLPRRTTGSILRLAPRTRCRESKASSGRLEQTGKSIEQRSVVVRERRRCASIENCSDKARAIDPQCARCVDTIAATFLMNEHAVTHFDGLRVIFIDEHETELHRISKRPVGYQANGQQIENVC